MLQLLQHAMVAIGSLTTLVAIIVLLTAGLEWYADWKSGPDIPSYNQGCHSVRERLRNDSWWFSESPETQELLADLARGIGVSEAREKWRRARAAAEKSEAEC